MGKAIKVIAWMFTSVMILTVIFVKAPKAANGKSGGEQASEIIKTAGGAIAVVVNSVMGGNI